ncbi:MAG: class I SAM-dependent methyltransferase [Stackebrandtia sp.]
MVEQLWDGHLAGRKPETLESQCATGRDWFYLAVLSFVDGRDGAAAGYAARAAALTPRSRVFAAAATYLTTMGKQGRQQVYTSPEGFAAFIRGGGNVSLYRALSTALRERYRRHRPVSLLDIGVGDGLALLPALSGDVVGVDLVEPSAALLESTSRSLTDRGFTHRLANTKVQALTDGVDAWPIETHWTIAEATFSLHNLTRDNRREVLTWLRGHVDRLLIAEFDLSPGTSCEPDWFDYVTTRYESGLAEYEGDGGLVAQGFLMPIMFGYFDPDTVHHEQSLSKWQRDLEAAGFTDLKQPELLHDYWWAPGYLIDAA